MMKDVNDKMVEAMTNKIVEYSHCFNQSREDYNMYKFDSSLGSPNSKVSL